MNQHGQPIHVKLTLLGDCNRCGRCCSAEISGVFSVCEHLRYERLDDVRAGVEQASWCARYADRTDGMPVSMLVVDGSVVLEVFRCYVNSANETRTIIERGLGSGCSLGMCVTEDPCSPNLGSLPDLSSVPRPVPSS